MPPWIPEKYTPCNDIDVYLEPLIDELKNLWEEGAVTFDAQEDICYACMHFVDN